MCRLYNTIMAEKLLSMINDPSNANEQEVETETIEEEQPHLESEIEDVKPKVIDTLTDDMFIRDDDVPIKKETQTQKKKRVMSQAQLNNLKKAREASAIRRKALKEAKDIEKAAKRMDLEAKKDAKLEKQMEQQSMIDMKAKLMQNAEKNATWDESRLEKLMEKTLDNYIAKRKKEKAPTTRQPLVSSQPITQVPHYQQQQQQQQQPQQAYYPQQTQQQLYRPLHNMDDNPFSKFMG